MLWPGAQWAWEDGTVNVQLPIEVERINVSFSLDLSSGAEKIFASPA